MKPILAALFSGLYMLSFTTAFAAPGERLATAKQLVDANRLEEALQLTRLMMGEQPIPDEARFLHGVVLSKLERNQEAIAVFEAMTREHPELPEPYNNLAVLYGKRGEFHKARDALLSAINTHPSYARAYENLGNIYAKMAISAYNRALELDKKQKPEPIVLAMIEEIGPRGQRPNQAAPGLPADTTVAASTTAPPPVDYHSDEEMRAIIQTVFAWSQAWSARDPQDYLSYYAKDFQPPKGQSRRAWENNRTQRLRAPKFIDVKVSSPEVVFLNENLAQFTFTQNYRSDRFRDATRKVMLMTKVGEQWQILKEETAK